MRRLGILTALLLSVNSHAYVRTLSMSGGPLFWPTRALGFQANPNNISGLTANEVANAFQSSAARWSGAGSTFSLGYSQSTAVAPQTNYDGVNTIYFASQSGQQLEYGVVAQTQVFYYTNNSQIVEADLVFNDRQFRFTNHEGDTGRAGFGVIYLGDVATHEFGHAIGLDHSIVANSSMIYTAFSGEFALGQDDITAIRTIAPTTGGLGAILGNVVGTRGGIFGTHVSAINQTTGEVEASTLAEANGTFRIGDLPSGDYVVFMEPFGVSPSTESLYWQNINHRFCSGSRFRRTFFAACGSSDVATVHVNSGQEIQLGNLTPSCSQMGNPSGVPSSLGSALSISARGGARYGTLSENQTHYYKLQNVSGTISARVATYSLFSNINTRVDLLDQNGSLVSASTTLPDVENPMPGGYINYDAFVEAQNLRTGTYYVRVSSAEVISSSVYPTGSELRDNSGHYLLMVGVNGEHGQPTTTDMSACISVVNTPQAATVISSGADDRDEDSGGGCGTVQDPPNDIGSALGGPLLGVLGLFCFFGLRRSLAAIRIRR